MWAMGRQQELIRDGAVDVTDKPEHLFDSVLRILGRKQDAPPDSLSR